MRILGASLALSKALQRYPGSKPLGVRLLPGREPVYAVRLRRGDRIIIMRVNAVTGAILR
ncbi:MAG TPA: hypothetical protein ENK15_01470 [Thermopetrobacter sp.]|nr:hypothetical protein [Thermopetrobacter sp.]